MKYIYLCMECYQFDLDENEHLIIHCYVYGQDKGCELKWKKGKRRSKLYGCFPLKDWNERFKAYPEMQR